MYIYNMTEGLKLKRISRTNTLFWQLSFLWIILNGKLLFPN